jgi:hypothetical protein
MKKLHKNLIGKMLLDIAPTLIGSVSKHFLKGGKTKLGVYLTALSTLSIKFFFDIDLESAAANPAALPGLAKAALGAGGVALGVGVGHDIFKKARGILKDVKNIF